MECILSWELFYDSDTHIDVTSHKAQYNTTSAQNHYIRGSMFNNLDSNYGIAIIIPDSNVKVLIEESPNNYSLLYMGKNQHHKSSETDKVYLFDCYISTDSIEINANNESGYTLTESMNVFEHIKQVIVMQMHHILLFQ